MPEPVPTQLLQLSVCAVDLDRGVVLRDNETTALTSKEFGLLVLLSGHPGVTFSRDALLREVWQQDSPGLTRAVDIAMRRLRQKVEANASRPEHLLTVRGEGYRYQGQPRIQLTAPARLAPTQLTNLGAASDLFIGRGADLDALEQSLSSTKRLLTLIGPPGVGKTRLARQFGRRVLANYPGGVWFCDLTSATSLASVYMALAHGLTLSLTRSGASPASQIGAELATRGRTLVLLDNAEQVAEEVAETLTEWIQRAPEVQWVVTSRVRLQLRAEHLVPVEPLEVSTGAALFANRAQMANRSFQLNRSNRAQGVVCRASRQYASGHRTCSCPSQRTHPGAIARPLVRPLAIARHASP